MYLILFVLHQDDAFNEIINAWEEAGVGGITILPGTGLGRMRRKTALREDLPLIPSLEDLLDHQEDQNHTMFTVVEGEEMVKRIIDATQSIIGDLAEPDTGILTVLPVAQVYGLKKNRKANE